MARGTTLGALVTDLRIEARYDPNPALSLNMVPMMQQTLRRNQEFLYDEFDWPFLEVFRDIPLEAGSRYYDFPDDMNLERVQKVDVLHAGTWQPVIRGIELDHYNAQDSEGNERTDPIQFWDVVEVGGGPQIEVWPLPATNTQKMRLRGIRSLKPLVKDSDVAELDDMMIVLYSAGELLGGAKDPLAEVKFQQAKARRETLQGRTTKTRHNRFSLGGEQTGNQGNAARPMLTAYVDRNNT
jgi:hypothetical protein